MKMMLPLSFLCWFIALAASAEITTDGTLGDRTELSGTNYQVTANLGQQFGNNLFHSFERFNLSSGEMVTFSGTGEIHNIISRVTGGTISQIDGTIRSEIPNANLYFINPYGVMFGKNAQLDISGRFYVSTADVLHLSDGGEFNARAPQSSLLTAAPVAAFGFLTDKPSMISVQHAQLANSHLGLIGGDLNLDGAHLHAEHVQLTSLNHQGTATDSIDLSIPQGKITLTDSTLDTSGDGGGQIWIRGGQLIMQQSVLRSDTQGQLNGQGINIATSENINISGNQVALSSVTIGQGNSGSIELNTPELTMQGSVIESSSLNIGHAGNIRINSQRTRLTQGAVIISDILNEGYGGNIELTATESLKLEGKRAGTVNIAGRSLGANNPTWIGTTTFGDNRASNILIHAGAIDLTNGILSSMSVGGGDGGDVSVYGNSLKLFNGGLIDCLGLVRGGAGSILAHINGDIEVIGFFPGIITLPNGLEVPDTESGMNSVTFGIKNAGNVDIVARHLLVDGTAITASTLSDGDAGLITINVESLHMKNGGQVDSTSGLILGKDLIVGNGSGGSIHINANKEILIEGRDGKFRSGFFTSTRSSQGKAGNIELNTSRLIVDHEASVATHSSGANNGGYIHILSNDLIIANLGTIGSESMNSTGSSNGGGTITLEVSHLVYLNNGKISTSVLDGSGDGGNIEILSPRFSVLNHSVIKAQAERGNGGNIRLVAANFIQSSDSLISASSRLGIDGNVLIKSPEETISNSIIHLNNNFLDVSNLFPQSCRSKTFGQRPSEFMRPLTFTIDLFKRFPLTPDNLFSSLSRCI